MKLIWYELQKIINKQFIIIIVVSLILNVGIAYLSTENPTIDGDEVAKYYESFRSDPEKVTDVWQRLEQMPESVSSEITIGQYLVIVYALRLIAACFISAVCSLISHMVKNPIAAMAVPVVVFGAPYVGGQYSDAVFAIDTFSIMAANKYTLFSSNKDILGDMGACAIAALMIAALGILVIRTLIKKYERA